MRGFRGVRKDSECVAAKLVEWKQFVIQMPTLLQKVDMALSESAEGERISVP
jgi:hypothetical protein